MFSRKILKFCTIAYCTCMGIYCVERVFLAEGNSAKRTRLPQYNPSSGNSAKRTRTTQYIPIQAQ